MLLTVTLRTLYIKQYKNTFIPIPIVTTQIIYQLTIMSHNLWLTLEA